MKIRKAKSWDLDSLTELYMEFLSYTNQFGTFVYKKIPKIDKAELKEGLKNLIKTDKDRIFLVAEDENILLGFIQVEILSSQESKTNKQIIEVVDIYSKGKGIGKRLFKEVEKWAKTKKAEFIQWEFISGNKLAEKFCIKNGFRQFKIKMLKKLK